MNFTNRELYLLSEGILSLIREACEAAKRVRSEKIIDDIAAYRSGLRDLNSKLCSMMHGDGENSTAPDNADPNILIYVEGGMVQGVSCNIPGATCEVFDADCDDEDEEDKETGETAEERWDRMVNSMEYHGIY